MRQAAALWTPRPGARRPHTGRWREILSQDGMKKFAVLPARAGRRVDPVRARPAANRGTGAGSSRTGRARRNGSPATSERCLAVLVRSRAVPRWRSHQA